MSISYFQYTFLSWLSRRNVLPPHPDVIELGEQHWHGDVPLPVLFDDIRDLKREDAEKQMLSAELAAMAQRSDKARIFDIAKIFYKVFLNYRSICAIDLHGTEAAYPFNLNEPVSLDKKFDITINFGTGEHVFNTYQFFKTVHELTAPGGIMLHVMPFWGWVDHGFFNMQPTFYWDLAESNAYGLLFFMANLDGKMIGFRERDGILKALQERIHPQGHVVSNSANIYAVMKQNNHPKAFQIPQQAFFKMTRQAYWDLSMAPI